MSHIFLVISRPSSPDRVDEFNQWYDDVHIPEVCAVDGIVGATRLAPEVDGDPFAVMYELEGDPHAAVAGIRAKAAAGGFNMSDVLSLDPLPQMYIMKVHSHYKPD